MNSDILLDLVSPMSVTWTMPVLLGSQQEGYGGQARSGDKKGQRPHPKIKLDT